MENEKQMPETRENQSVAWGDVVASPLEGNPFASLPLHRLLAYGRDHGSATPGLAEAVGVALAGNMLESGLSAEQRLATARAVGERVLGDKRLLGLAPWPEFGSTNGWADLKALGERLAVGLPLSKRIEYPQFTPDGAEVFRERVAEDLRSRVVEAYQRLEGKWRPLWPMPEHTPQYLLPREQMRAGQVLADASLWDLVERGWDARIMVHLTARANSHPASREDPRERWRDAAIDTARLEAIEVKIGERIWGRAGASPPEGLRLEHHESFLRGVGEALLKACYSGGYVLIEWLDSLWHKGEWQHLRDSDFISQEECEKLQMWSARDYKGLLKVGVIDEYDYERFQLEEYHLARRQRGRKDALIRARDLAGQLEQLGVTRAVTHYNGYGDSVQIESIQFYAGDAVATVPCPLATDMGTICMFLGCGSGALTLDVLQRRLVLDTSERDSTTWDLRRGG